MHILQGIVKKFRSTVEINGGGGGGRENVNVNVTTTHVSVFHLNGKHVKIKSREVILIDDDDHVTVAGKERNGVFNAYAYRNDTTGALVNTGSTPMIILGCIVQAIGLFLLFKFSDLFIQFPDSFVQIIPILFALIFILAGATTLYKGIQILKAFKQLQKQI